MATLKSKRHRTHLHMFDTCALSDGDGDGVHSDESYVNVEVTLYNSLRNLTCFSLCHILTIHLRMRW